MKRLNRREFVKLASAGFAGFGLASSGLSVARAVPQSGFKALIILELLGGVDNLYFATPTESALYNAIAARRGASIIPTTFNLNSFQLPVALHPSLAPLQPYLGNSRITMNLGNAMHVNGNGSHENMQLRMAIGGTPNDAGTVGWAARVYDTVPSLKLYGFQGSKNQNFNCSSEKCAAHRPPVYKSYETFRLDGSSLHAAQGGSANTAYVAQVLERLADVEPAREVSPLEQKYRQSFSGLFPVIADVQETLTYVTPEAANYPDSALGIRFRNMASTLKRLDAEGSNEQVIFLVGIGGYDVHDSWTNRSTNLMSTLAGLLRPFCDDLTAMGLFNNVVITTMTEFGRQIAANGSGTDHGVGFSALTIGGLVNGGTQALYGAFPTVEYLQSSHSFPRIYDSRALIADILEYFVGVDPYQTAFPGVLGSQFTRVPFNLFV